MEKDRELVTAVEFLRRRFGEAMAVVDHWEGDLTAVGVARKDDKQRLAYLSVSPTVDGPRFYVALEDPPTPGSDMPYASAGDHADLTWLRRQISWLDTLVSRSMRTLPNQPLQLSARALN